MYVCVYIYIYIHIHTYIHAYIHTRTCITYKHANTRLSLRVSVYDIASRTYAVNAWPYLSEKRKGLHSQCQTQHWTHVLNLHSMPFIVYPPPRQETPVHV